LEQPEHEDLRLGTGGQNPAPAQRGQLGVRRLDAVFGCLGFLRRSRKGKALEALPKQKHPKTASSRRTPNCPRRTGNAVISAHSASFSSVGGGGTMKSLKRNSSIRR